MGIHNCKKSGEGEHSTSVAHLISPGITHKDVSLVQAPMQCPGAHAICIIPVWFKRAFAQEMLLAEEVGESYLVKPVN